MRVVLVDNLLLEQNGAQIEAVLQPHLGLISLAAVGEAAGYDVALFDPKIAVARDGLALDSGLYRRIAERVLALGPKAVGLTSFGCNFICTLKVASYIRRAAPEVAILLGGPHATVLERSILERFDVFDVIVRHEAESTFVPVLQRLGTRDLAEVPGIAYRSGQEVRSNPGSPIVDDLDTLPIPSYRHYPIRELGLDWLRVEAGRGCPFGCTFCSTATFFGRRYRVKSARRLCRELDLLNEAYGVRHFSLQHDLFTVDRDAVVAFCEAVRPRGYTWKCSARMDCVDPDLLASMSASGCREIYFGVETGSPRMQAISQKKLDLRLFYPTLDAAEASNLATTVSFITGYPEEDAEDQAATLDLIGSCFYRNPPPSNVQLHLMTPEPGTRLLEQHADKLRFDGYVSDFTFPTLEADDTRIMQDAQDVFVNNHYFEAQLPRARHLVVTTLYYSLYALSPPVLAHVIDQYGGRYSRLVSHVDRWAQAEAVVVIDAGALNRFFREEWGIEHYLTSLVAYLLELGHLPRPSRGLVIDGARPVPTAGRTTWNPDAKHVLSTNCLVIDTMHGCVDLLAAIDEHWHARTPSRVPRPPAVAPPQNLPDGTSGLLTLRRGALSSAQVARVAIEIAVPGTPAFRPTQTVARSRPQSLVVMTDGCSDTVRNFEIDSVSRALLELFRNARRPRDVLSVGGAREARDIEARLRRLVEAGVLARVGRGVRQSTEIRASQGVAAIQGR
jgi:radical SAM superfamily enzyme YgiQ (UPF0313 family)